MSFKLYLSLFLKDFVQHLCFDLSLEFITFIHGREKSTVR